jgi:hypothetical protein
MMGNKTRKGKGRERGRGRACEDWEAEMIGLEMGKSKSYS